MTIDEAMIAVLAEVRLQGGTSVRESLRERLRATLASVFESGMQYQLEELRRNIEENGPDTLLDYDIEYQLPPGKRHGILMFQDRTAAV